MTQENSGRGGVQTDLGSVPSDKIGQACVPTPLSVMTKDNGIRTLSPSAMPDAENRDYKSRVVWVVNYKDGQTIAEYDQHGNNVSSTQIDRKKIREFKLIDRKARTVISLDIHPGHCFFYRRRTALITGRDVVEVMHMFGWRILRDGNVVMENLIMLYESDMHVEVGIFDIKSDNPSNNLSGSKAWKYPPKWREEDAIAAE
jgi:hypothetical protein